MQGKTKEQPISELAELRQRIAELETAKAERKPAAEELRATKERLQYLVSSSPAVIYTSKPSGDYGATFISENVVSQMGYEPREFIEDPGFWADHIHPEDAPRIFDGLPRLSEHGHHTHEYRFLLKDGTYRWMRDELKLVRDDEGNPVEVIGYWIDITERKQTEEALRVQRDLAVVLNRTRSLSETLNAILEGIFQIEEFDSGGVYLLDEQAGEMVLTAHKNLPQWFVAQVSRFGRDTPQWQLVMKGEPIYQHASGFPPAIAKQLQSESIKALAVIPLKYGEKIIGDINLASHTHDEISEESKEIARSVANLVGTAITRAQAEEELRKHREHLEELVQERTTELQQEITERKRAEQELKQKMEELERFNRLAVGRELRMIELKRQINELSEQLGRDAPYDLSLLE